MKPKMPATGHDGPAGRDRTVSRRGTGFER